MLRPFIVKVSVLGYFPLYPLYNINIILNALLQLVDLHHPHLSIHI